MIPIPGILVALVTFPGVIVHEAAHLLFCKLVRVAVFDVCFFRIAPMKEGFNVSEPIGYVIHERPEGFLAAFFISVGPFILNSLLCIFFCLPAFFPVRLHDEMNPESFFFLWLGISIGMHAFPSSGDASVLYEEAKRAAVRWNPLAILSFPIVLLIYLANIGSMLWLDAIYAFAIGLGVPELLLRSLA